MSTELFQQFDRLFTQRIARSTADGRWGSHEVRTIGLIGDNRLRCAFDEERAYWYEVVFGDGEGSPIRFGPASDRPLSPGDTQILEDVLRENQR